MKLGILGMVLALVFVMGACADRPANSSYHNSSNDVRQNNKNANANVNSNANVVNANN